MAKQNGSRVITNKVRFLYPHLLEKYRNNMSGKENYSATILISKDDTETVDAIKAAMKVAFDEAKSTKNFGNRKPRTPLRDGDTDRADREEYKNCYFINASSNFKPDVVDRRGVNITNPDAIYSGMYGRVSLNFFGYSAAGNVGIGAGLGNVQKTEEGERLGGRMSAATEFSEFIDNNSSSDQSGDEDSVLPF